MTKGQFVEDVEARRQTMDVAGKREISMEVGTREGQISLRAQHDDAEFEHTGNQNYVNFPKKYAGITKVIKTEESRVNKKKRNHTANTVLQAKEEQEDNIRYGLNRKTVLGRVMQPEGAQSTTQTQKNDDIVNEIILGSKFHQWGWKRIGEK